MKLLALVGGALVLAITPGLAEAKSSGPRLALAPQTSGTYDYGIVNVGNHADQVFTMTNAGDAASAALAVALSGSSTFSKIGDTCSAVSLGPGKKCTVVVRYTPTDGGANTATLTATSSKPAATASIKLSGTGGVVDVEISPSTHDFGSTSGSQTFTATNAGNTASGTYTFSGPTDPHFNIAGTNTCAGSPLQAGASCSYTVDFTAPASCSTHPTLYQDTIQLGSYASATVSGRQPECLPRLAWAPCNKGSIPTFCENIFDPAGETISQAFILTNSGEASADLSFWSSLDPGFTIQPPTDPGNCQNTTTLAVGATCGVTLTWDGGFSPGCDQHPEVIPLADLLAYDATHNVEAELVNFEQC
jgi:hypothetical protein